MYVLKSLGAFGIFYTQLIVGGIFLNFVLYELNWLKLNNKTPYDFSYSTSLIFVLFYLTNSVCSLLYSKFKFYQFYNFGLISVSIGGVIQQCLAPKNEIYLFLAAIFSGIGIGFLNFSSLIFCEIYFRKKIRFFRALSFSGFGVGMLSFAFMSEQLMTKFSFFGASFINWALILSTLPFVVIFHIFDRQKIKKFHFFDLNFINRDQNVFPDEGKTTDVLAGEFKDVKIDFEFWFYLSILLISTFFYGLSIISCLIMFPHYISAERWDVIRAGNSLGFTGACYFFTRLVFTVVGHSRRFDAVVAFLSTVILSLLLMFIFGDLITTKTGQMTYSFFYGFGMGYWHVLVDSVTKVVFRRSRMVDLNWAFLLVMGLAAGVCVRCGKQLVKGRDFDEFFYFVGSCYFVMGVGGMVVKVAVLWGIPAYFGKKEKAIN